MDKGQILCDYRTAKNHKKQIPILAELNACSKEEIIDILRRVATHGHSIPTALIYP